MKIDHIALWVHNLEQMRQFYCHYFDMQSGEKYVNPQNQFSSYFLSHKSGTKIELMHQSHIKEKKLLNKFGWAHLAFSVGDKDAVDKLTQRFRQDGITVVGQPRTTGDGYYESVIEDPEGNKIELVAG